MSGQPVRGREQAEAPQGRLRLHLDRSVERQGRGCPCLSPPILSSPISSDRTGRLMSQSSAARTLAVLGRLMQRDSGDTVRAVRSLFTRFTSLESSIGQRVSNPIGYHTAPTKAIRARTRASVLTHPRLAVHPRQALRREDRAARMRAPSGSRCLHRPSSDRPAP